eukprot:gene43196-53615_t
MFPEAKNEYGFGYQYFSTIMAWRKGAKEPKNFTEFFDTKAFPSKRCLPDYPHYCLPFALQAAGVHAIPGLNLYDDFEGVAALVSELDLVLTPGVTIRDIASAVNVPVWSFTVIPGASDVWRKSAQRRDSWFPSI